MAVTDCVYLVLRFTIGLFEESSSDLVSSGIKNEEAWKMTDLIHRIIDKPFSASELFFFMY